MPANGKSNGRFTLPALTPVSFSLTDGTNIPPPPDSPIEEKAPVPNPVAESTHNITAHSNAAPSTNSYDGRGRSTDQPPMSPASSTRASSIRRFLSRKNLNSNYTNGSHDNGSNEDIYGLGRPDSPSSFLSGKPSMGKKRSGSWFSKLGGKRTSVIYENAPAQQQKMGPPPPKLPELNQLKAKVTEDDGSLGGDELFKNIRGE